MKPNIEQQESGKIFLSGTRMALLDIAAGFWSIRRQLDGLLGQSLTSSILQQAGTNGGASFANSLGESIKVSDQILFFETCLQAYQTAGFGRFKIKSINWPVGRIIIQGEDTFEAWMLAQHNSQENSSKCAYTAGVLVGFINVISGRSDIVCIEHQCQAMGNAFCEFELLPAAKAGGQRVISFSEDPKLSQQLNILDILFERMPMGIAIIDPDYHIQRYNRTWKEFWDIYSPPSAKELSPGGNYFDVLPGSEPIAQPLFERVMAGETIRQPAQEFESGGIKSYWDVVLAPLIENDEVSGILNVTSDVTEYTILQNDLEQRVEDRTRELHTLLQISQDINASLHLDNLLEIILEKLKSVVNFSRASILTVDGTDLRERIVFPTNSIDKSANSIARFEENFVNHEYFKNKKPLIINDIHSDAHPAKIFQEVARKEMATTFNAVHSWMGVPLTVKGKMVGMLTLNHDQPDWFTRQKVDFVLTFANHAAVAIENAQLLTRVESAAVASERNRLARDLHDAVTQNLFSASMIAEVLPEIWNRDPGQGLQRLDELRILTRGALSEMRTLLIELRPSALLEADIGDLIGHQINAFNARTRIPVEYDQKCEQNPPLEIKEAFYRISQEALNNIAKYADASIVKIRLNAQSEKAYMIIEDDGIGFDVEKAKVEGLGLGIMAERAKDSGAVFLISSQIGKGTQLEITWQGKNMENIYE